MLYNSDDNVYQLRFCVQLDVEGAEFEILNGMTDSDWARVDQVPVLTACFPVCQRCLCVRRMSILVFVMGAAVA